MERGSVRVLSVVVCSLLLACGGGGGGGAGSGGGGGGGIQVSWNPSSLRTTYAQGDLGLELKVTARLSSLPASSPYVILEDAEGALQDSTLNVEQSGANSFDAWLHPNCALPPGEHTGTLKLHLCQDAGCAQPYQVSGGLPYHFTVTPAALSLTASIGGSPAGVALRCSNPQPELVSGQLLELVSNVPVSWEVHVAVGAGIINLEDTASTTTTYQLVAIGTGNGGVPLPPGASPGWVMISARPVSDPTVDISMSFKVVGG